MKLSPSQRLSILCAWRKARGAGPLLGASVSKTDEQFLLFLECNGVMVTRSTLYLWKTRYNARGFNGLIDGRSFRPVLDRSADPFLQAVVRLRSASSTPQLSMVECRRLAILAAEVNGWKTHSMVTVRRYLRACGLGRKTFAREQRAKRVRRAFTGR